eukprot:CAMPEP_0181390590 /NCGR_PEP_ID=MMETSP1106-20121128/25569_1 /TAXON_ID=81844 /ORGANISM="Mantoniella antarctica, Strain SL-175" /LENGTH=129 /DNA_ID=CAMNT_0023511517 /DNA_START=101 /DNA_END=487 /DNA_ORIENTATION=-
MGVPETGATRTRVAALSGKASRYPRVCVEHASERRLLLRGDVGVLRSRVRSNLSGCIRGGFRHLELRKQLARTKVSPIRNKCVRMMPLPLMHRGPSKIVSTELPPFSINVAVAFDTCTAMGNELLSMRL